MQFTQRGGKESLSIEYLDIGYQGFGKEKAGNDYNLRLNFKRNKDEMWKK